MKFVLLFLFVTSLAAQRYNFDESRYISAISQTFKKSGVIVIEDDSVQISYNKPTFYKITLNKNGVSIEDDSKNITQLKGKKLLFSKLYLNLIKEINKSATPKNSDYFDVKRVENGYELYPKDEMKNYISKLYLHVDGNELVSFKIVMQNEDVIEIVKK
ncbi:MAG: hypothetical protein U9N42_10330 [Campylobacterota bacterium]|nr:hypothetical protein [Campylobacterota bacterium]